MSSPLPKVYQTLGPRLSMKSWLGHSLIRPLIFTAVKKCKIWPQFLTHRAFELPSFQNWTYLKSKRTLGMPMMGLCRAQIWYSLVYSPCKLLAYWAVRIWFCDADAGKRLKSTSNQIQDGRWCLNGKCLNCSNSATVWLHWNHHSNIWAMVVSGSKRGDYQNCSVLYCVLKVVHSHKHT